MRLIAGNVRTTTATGKSSLRRLTAFSLCCATSGRRVEAAVCSVWNGLGRGNNWTVAAMGSCVQLRGKA
jgi:hypothetical protein